MLASEIIRFGKKQAAKGRFLCAFNTCVDGVVKLPKGMSLPQPKLVGEIYDQHQLLSTLAYFVEKGAGGESIIASQEVCDWIGKNFKAKFQVGGQAGIVSETLASLKAKKVYCHSYSLSELKGKLLNSKILFPRLDHNGRIKYLPAGKLAFGPEREFHWIFNFRKGQRFGKRVAKETDRFIATFDRINSRMRVNPHFAHSLHKLAHHANTCLVAGFPLAEDTKDILKAKEVIGELKKFNPKLAIHLELGDMRKRGVGNYLLKEVFPLCGRVGMDETELELFSKGRLEGLEAQVRAGRKLASRAKLERLVVHAREHSFSVVSKGSRLSSKKELKALALGNLVAKAKASCGRTPTWKDVSRVADKQIECEVRGQVAICFNKPIRAKTTLGLGDAFTAGLLVGEL